MDNCKRCEEWSELGLSNTCPSCDMDYDDIDEALEGILQ